MIDECFSKDTVEEIIKSLVRSVLISDILRFSVELSFSCANRNTHSKVDIYSYFREWKQAKKEMDGLDQF